MKSTITTVVTTVRCDWCDACVLLERAKAEDWKTLTVFEREIDDDEPGDEVGKVFHLCATCRPRVGGE